MVKDILAAAVLAIVSYIAIVAIANPPITWEAKIITYYVPQEPAPAIWR